MFTWDEINKFYIFRHSDAIRKVTKPLREHFGISYFTYHFIDDAGNYLVLVDRPDWAEHYVGHQMYLDDPYLRHPAVYQSGVASMTSYGSEAYRERLMTSGKSVLDVDVAVTLIEKDVDSVEFFGFAAPSQSSSLGTLYINHLDLLKSFAVHFKRESSQILAKMKDEGASLPLLKGDDFFCQESLHPSVSAGIRTQFYKDLGIIPSILGADPLSKREKQLLKLLLKNYSAKDMGCVLNISHRTVESYFENIKNKLSLWNRQELFDRARRLFEVGLL